MGLLNEYEKKDVNRDQKLKNQQISNNKRKILDLKSDEKYNEINTDSKNNFFSINNEKKDIFMEFRSKDFSGINASDELWGVALLVENTKDNQSEEFHRWFSRTGTDYQAVNLPTLKKNDKEFNDFVNDVVIVVDESQILIDSKDLNDGNENEYEKDKSESKKRRSRGGNNNNVEMTSADDRIIRNNKRRKEDIEGLDSSGPESIGYRVSGAYRNAVDQSTVNCDSSSEESYLKLDQDGNEGEIDNHVKTRRFLSFNPKQFEENIGIGLQDGTGTEEYSGINNDYARESLGHGDDTDVKLGANSDKMMLQDYLTAAYNIGFEFVEKGCMVEVRGKEVPFSLSPSSSSTSTSSSTSSSSSSIASLRHDHPSPTLIPHTDPRSQHQALPSSLCTVLRVLLLSSADSALQQSRNATSPSSSNGNHNINNNGNDISDKYSATSTSTASATSTSTSGATASASATPKETVTPSPSCTDSSIVNRNVGFIPGSDHSNGIPNTVDSVPVDGNSEEPSFSDTLPNTIESIPRTSVCSDITQGATIADDAKDQDIHDYQPSTSISISSGGFTKWIEIFDGKIRRIVLLSSCRQFLVGMERALDALHTHSYAPVEALKSIRADLELKKMKFHISRDENTLVNSDSERSSSGELGSWTKRELELFVRAKKR